MGYKSKVRIGTTIRGLEFLKGYVESKLMDDFEGSYINNYDVFFQDKGVIVIGWNWVNFELNNPDVEAIYEALDIMEEREIPYRLWKIGENYAEYEAIEIVDMDPFNQIPYMYTEIDFTGTYKRKPLPHQWEGRMSDRVSK